MNINQVKTATKIGDFVIRQNHRNKIKVVFLSQITKEELRDSIPRVYLFTVDGIIKKIGGSAGKGGIKSTINLYTSAMTGSPGVPRFVCHLLIERSLMNGSKVELFMITSPKVKAPVTGLFTHREEYIASFKEMEGYCKEDYFGLEKKYPDWNFQENNEDYPVEFAKLHNLYHHTRLKNKKQTI